MKYPQVRFPVWKLRKGTTIHDCVGYEFDNPTHYHAALEPPHYAMPALRYDVEIDAESVSLYTHTSGIDWRLVMMWTNLSHH